MKIGIIGAGIAGLACGHRLSKNNFDVTIFEQEPYSGGRVIYSFLLARKTTYETIASLVKELELEGMEIKIPIESMAFLAGDQVIPAEGIENMFKEFNPEELKYYNDLTEFTLRLSFNPENPSSELIGLRNQTFAEYLKNAPQKIVDLIIRPMTTFTLEPDFNKISAEFGLYFLRDALELISGEAYAFEENILPLTNALHKRIEENGGQIHLSSAVSNVEKEDGKFKIFYKKAGGESGVEIVDRLVMATPLFITKQIFPDVFFNDIAYSKLGVLFTEGDLKDSGRNIILGFPGNKANILIFWAATPFDHRVFPFDADKPVDLSFIYKKDNFRIIDKKIIEAAVPKMESGFQVSELRTNIENVFICGDFYYYPSLETAALTGEMVAKMIIS